MRKILFVMPALYGGGAEKSLVNLLNLIDYKKYAVDLLLFKQEGLFLTQIPKEVRLLPLTASLRYAYKIDMGMFGSLSGFKTGMLRLMGTVVCKVLYKEKAGQQRWVKCYKHCLPNLEGNYDIAVGFLEGEASYYVIDKVNAEKKILWIHNDFNEIKKNEDAKIYENYFQKADSVVSISDKCVQILKQNYPKLTNKFYCLPNLTSGSLLKKMSEEFEVPEYEKNKFNILSIGRLTRQKGYDFAIDAIKKFRASKIFLGILGVSIHDGVTHPAIEEVPVMQALLEISHKKYLIADTTKYGKAFLGKIAGLSEFDTLIVDEEMPEIYYKYAEEHGIRII